MGSGRQKVPPETPSDQFDLVDEGMLDDGWCPPDKPAQWTLDQVKKHRPRDYERAVRLLAAGLGYLDVAEACRMSNNVIRRIAADEQTLVAQKERLGKAALGVSRMAFDLVGERLGDPEEAKKISAKDLIIVGGIAAQRGTELTASGLTANVNVSIEMTLEEYQREMERLRTGSTARNPAAKGAGQPGDAPEVLEPGERPAGDVMDLPPSTPIN